MLMIHGNSLMILIPPQGSKVIWILFSCFDPRDNCDILLLLLHPLVIHNQNKTSIFQILFCMFPWVWECTSSSDAGGGFIIRECSDMIWLWCWYSIINCLLWCGLWVCDGIAQNWIEASKWVKRKRWIFTFKIIHVMIDDCHWSFFSVP